ncbi:hypothetical protein PSHT_14540 [Puccinia striiformis]|uniref:Uncharacterized protein n=1 Tax=Puccinia striiformis TaxID=27350 RepID=A0A2S4UJJ4_9BASI|nr:hypothetical protein PSHT_14540 [Puccinia striiformis]
MVDISHRSERVETEGWLTLIVDDQPAAVSEINRRRSAVIDYILTRRIQPKTFKHTHSRKINHAHPKVFANIDTGKVTNNELLDITQPSIRVFRTKQKAKIVWIFRMSDR